MVKSPAFQFYPKDLLADTAHLSTEAFGAYWKLISYAWVGIAGCDQGTLPKDDEALAMLTGLGGDGWQRVKSRVLALFVEADDHYTHKRLASEKVAQTARRRQTKRAAKIRWNKEKDAASIPGAIHPQCTASSSSSLSSSSDLGTSSEQGRNSCSSEVLVASEILDSRTTTTAIVRECNTITGRSLSLTPQRERKILARLREGFTPEQMLDAMRGAYGDPYYRGSDPKTNGRRYDQPETVFRDAGCVERHLEHWQRLQDGQATVRPLNASQRRVASNIEAIANWRSSKESER